MEKFDLTRALAGEQVIDAKGREYKGFFYTKSFHYKAYCDDKHLEIFSFDSSGECLETRDRNLFMKHSKQKTMKPFDLEATKRGDIVINSSRPNDKGLYLTTLNISECNKEIHQEIYRHIFIFTQPDNRQYVTHCKDNGDSRTFGIGISDGRLFMAPKKVKYYFTSWQRIISANHDRNCSQLYLSKEKAEHIINMLQGAKGALIHEIEIEE